MHELTARPVKHLHQHENRQDGEREHGQRHMVAAVHHAVINLQHVG